ncbi:cell wall protein [Streptomyces sp. NPDC059783]|uniref:cell wall protein n=1 Tax=Streptomyces sp. NPDC059783 TaxID=3346944 RepID=UPI0036650FCA
MARDLAKRMDYRLGFVLYDLEGTAARCGVSVATVKRHVRVLRELGALVWQRHGSKRNLHLPGRAYAGTATIYAATVPAVYDAAMGHWLDGTGYGARVVGVARTGRRAGGPAPHSLRPRPHAPTDDVREGGKDTLRARAHVRASRRRPSARHPLQVARDIAVARQVRPLVGWTQGEGLRRLAFALRPLIDRGAGVQEIAAQLHAWWLDWRPARPAAYITAELRRRADRETPPGHTGEPPEAFSRTVTDLRAADDPAPDGPAPDPAADPAAGAPAADGGPPHGIEALSPADIVELRSAAAHDHRLVLSALEYLGERDTRRLYTNRLVDTARLRAFGGARLAVGY